MRRWLFAIWACALARLLFYAAMLPIWEGYDEWSHFSVIRAVAAGQLLPPRDAPVPADVAASLRSVPVPWDLRYLTPPSETHDDFWSRGGSPAPGPRPPAPKLTAYESLQAPLYYWLMAPLLRVLGGCSLATQVLALRFVAVLIASFTIPLVFFLAHDVLTDPRLALGCAAVVAVMPGFAFDVARVSNDCLAVPLFTAFLCLAAPEWGRRFRLPTWLLPGVLLGLGLLTKAYFLTTVVAALWMPRAVLVGIAISGWWYVRNLLTTGTLAGLSESVMLRGSGTLHLLHNVLTMPWHTGVDSILLSHLYFGGWSSLTVRSWMYHALYLVIVAAAFGCLPALWRNAPLFRVALLYGAFWLGQLYNVVLIFSSKGVPTSMGWYLYAVIGAEVVLAIAGLGRFLGLWAPALGAALFAALDLYATHFVAIPYYTGFIRHRPSGALESLHLSAIRPGLMLGRLAEFKAPLISPTVVTAFWILYLLATLILVALSVRRFVGAAYMRPAARKGHAPPLAK